MIDTIGARMPRPCCSREQSSLVGMRLIGIDPGLLVTSAEPEQMTCMII